METQPKYDLILNLEMKEDRLVATCIHYNLAETIPVSYIMVSNIQVILSTVSIIEVCTSHRDEGAFFLYLPGSRDNKFPREPLTYLGAKRLGRELKASGIMDPERSRILIRGVSKILRSHKKNNPNFKYLLRIKTLPDAQN